MTRAEALALLGLPDGASAKDADRRFRDLAKRHHPDAAPGDGGAAARFARLVEARNRLRDPAPDPPPPSPSPPEPPSPRHGSVPRRTLHVPPDILVRGGLAEAEASWPCPACGGTGWWRIRLLMGIPFPCPSCEGRGTGRRTLRVRIPPGIAAGTSVEIDGARFHLFPALPEGMWHEGPDLLAERALRPGAFRRGTRIALEIPDGRLRLRIPPGTLPGTVLRIRGRGLPDGRGGRGDLRLRLSKRP